MNCARSLDVVLDEPLTNIMRLAEAVSHAATVQNVY